MHSKPSRFDRMNEMMWEALINSYEGSTKRECSFIWETRDVSWVGLWRVALLWAVRDRWEERGYFQAMTGDMSKGIKATWAKNTWGSVWQSKEHAKRRGKKVRRAGSRECTQGQQRIGGVIHQGKENRWCSCWGSEISHRGRIRQLITCWGWGRDGGEKSQC